MGTSAWPFCRVLSKPWSLGLPPVAPCLVRDALLEPHRPSAILRFPWAAGRRERSAVLGARAMLAVPAEVRCQQRVQNTRPSCKCDAAASALLLLPLVTLCKADAGLPRVAAQYRQSPGSAARLRPSALGCSVKAVLGTAVLQGWVCSVGGTVPWGTWPK